MKTFTLKWAPFIIAMASLLIAGWTNYDHQHDAFRVDIVTLQVQQREDHERLERIEKIVQRIYDKVSGW